MIDFGFDKLALIGAVALIVIGPEKLPRVARTVGTLIGKAQRYVADVRAEVNRSIDLEEMQKVKKEFESAASNITQSVQTEVNQANSAFESNWTEASAAFESGAAFGSPSLPLSTPVPEYKHPKKKWRLKRGAMPAWYKQRHGVRGKAQSGAARVARFRPPARPA